MFDSWPSTKSRMSDLNIWHSSRTSQCQTHITDVAINVLKYRQSLQKTIN